MLFDVGFEASVSPVLLLNSAFSIESKHEVTILGGLNEFVVKFHGPAGCKRLFERVLCSASCAFTHLLQIGL